VRISNKSKPVRDFIAWMLDAPAVSERARSKLEAHLGERVEFLPLIHVKGVQVYAVNVLNMIDCLDIARSEVAFSASKPGRVVSVIRFALDERKIPSDPVIFKVPESGIVFISSSVADLIVEHRLSGALLVEPTASPFAATIPGRPGVWKPVQ
jgi:hypothetical protein